MPKYLSRISRDEYTKQLLKIADEIDKFEEELTEKYKKLLVNAITELCKEVIGSFYADYDPKFYNRKRDLYNVFKIKIEDENLIVDFNSDYMKYNHRAKNEYIFDIAFINGWHGGADHIDSKKIDNWGAHPQVGYPYWRTPIWGTKDEDGNPITPFIDWGSPAVISPSPFEEIESLLQITINNVAQKIEIEYNKKIKKYIGKINKLNRQRK